MASTTDGKDEFGNILINRNSVTAIIKDPYTVVDRTKFDPNFDPNFDYSTVTMEDFEVDKLRIEDKKETERKIKIFEGNLKL